MKNGFWKLCTVSQNTSQPLLGLLNHTNASFVLILWLLNNNTESRRLAIVVYRL
jgi:hypothetical protein